MTKKRQAFPWNRNPDHRICPMRRKTVGAYAVHPFRVYKRLFLTGMDIVAHGRQASSSSVQSLALISATEREPEGLIRCIKSFHILNAI